MSVFFLFSDASGKYKKERNDKFITKNPFFCRAAVLLNGLEWLKLQEEFKALKKNFFKANYSQEIKWSYIWSLYKHRQKGESIQENKSYYPLRNYSLDKLIEFIRQALQLLTECGSSRVILTMTFNDREKTKPIETKTVNKMHLRHIMSMAEEEMRKKPDNVCLFFLNPEEPPVEKYLRESFFEILGQENSKKYSRIKESLTFEHVSQSFGSQLADYCAGVFNGCLRLYPQSIDLFRHQIWPRILKKKNKILGHGITEIPKNLENRAGLEERMEKIFETKEKDYRFSVEERLKK